MTGNFVAGIFLYNYLKMTVTKSPPFSKSGYKIIPDIIKKNSKGCLNKIERKIAMCILLKIVKEQNIKIYSVRFDEGKKIDTEIIIK